MVLIENQENEIQTIRLNVLSYITMISFLSLNVTKQLFPCLIKRLKCLWCFHGFYKIKLEIEGNAGITSLIGDAMTRGRTLVKIAYFSGFKHS